MNNNGSLKLVGQGKILMVNLIIKRKFDGKFKVLLKIYNRNISEAGRTPPAFKRGIFMDNPAKVKVSHINKRSTYIQDNTFPLSKNPKLSLHKGQHMQIRWKRVIRKHF